MLLACGVRFNYLFKVLNHPPMPGVSGVVVINSVFCDIKVASWMLLICGKLNVDGVVRT